MSITTVIPIDGVYRIETPSKDIFQIFMAELWAIKANVKSLKEAILKQRLSDLKPIELPKEALYKAKSQLRKAKVLIKTSPTASLPILLNKKTPTSIAIKSFLLNQTVI